MVYTQLHHTQYHQNKESQKAQILEGLLTITY